MHPNGRFIYTSRTDSVTAFSMDRATGALSVIGTVNLATGSGPNGNTVSPDGAFLYTANLGDGTVSTRAINPSDGSLTLASTTAVLGSNNLYVRADPTSVVSLNVTEAIVKSLNPSWKVIKIPSAAEGLESMLGVEPTPLFALLDLQMPNMDGYQPLEECKRRTGDLKFPVFLLSAHITTEVAERAADVPIIRCVFPKPVHAASLMYHLIMSGVSVE